jgi:transposase, IS5 family
MQVGFFEVTDSYARLDKAGDPLVTLNNLIDWKSLEPHLKKITYENSGKGGRPSWDKVVIVKCLLLQALYNLSDESLEYQVNDRLSFKRFLGLDASDKSPDAKTMWIYRERMKWSGLEKVIFDWFEGQLIISGYSASEGRIIDASFVPTHKPTGTHKKQLEEEIPLTPNQAQQIDTDATFTKKNERTYHGYKNHIQVDKKHKFIRQAKTTTASTHDSQVFEELLNDKNDSNDVWADSAYRSEETEEMLTRKGFVSHIIERAYRNRPLTAFQKKCNRLKSTVRVRVEHVFGDMTTAMGGLLIHTLGLGRAHIKVTFKNLAYNMRRFVCLQTRHRQAESA